MTGTRPNLARGFTLIEFIVVLVLIAVVIAIGLPKLNFFGRSRDIGNAANQVLALARYARTQSVSKAVSYRLNFDATQRSWWLTVQNGPGYENFLQSNQEALPAGNTYDAVTEEHGKVFLAPEGVNFECQFPPQSDGVYL